MSSSDDNSEKEKTYKEFTTKFSCDGTTLKKFLEQHLVIGKDVPEKTLCSNNKHNLEPNMRMYLFNGEPQNLQTHFCRDKWCFLGGMDDGMITTLHQRNNGDTKTTTKHTILNKKGDPSKQNIKHNKKGQWFCHTCGTDITKEKLQTCKKYKHQWVWNKPSDDTTSNGYRNNKDKKQSDGNDGEQISHTEYALSIMRGKDFATLRDTDEVLEYKNGVYDHGGEVAIKEEAEDMIRDCSTYMRNEITNTIKARTYKYREDFDQNPLLLNVKNGLINLESLVGEYTDNIPCVNLRKIKLEQHTPYQLSRIQLNVVFNPNAAPKKFIKFMSEILHDHNDRLLIYELFASALLRHALNLEKCMMFVGEGANGKSTLLKVMTEVFGKPIISHVSIHDLIYNRFSRATLDGKLLNIYTDISNNELDKMGLIKALISGDPITVEKKNKPQYTMVNVARLFFSCNRLPEIDEDSDAIFRRFSIVNFLQQFRGKKKNANLFEALTTEEERSGIFNLLLVHAIRLLRRKRLTNDVTISQIRQEWKERADPVENFVKICLKNVDNINTLKSEVYSEYAKFCKDRDLKPRSTRSFTERMKNLGYEDGMVRISNKMTRVWLDIELHKFPSYKIGDIKHGSDGSSPVTDVEKRQETSDDNKIDDYNKSDGDKQRTTVDYQDGYEEGLSQETWFKCVTCDAGPWKIGATGSSETPIFKFHAKQKHKLIRCNSDGQHIPGGDLN